ncbi:MAG: hypothetical protein ACRDTC_03555 [Pseudonocardiaceae bacterium]
MNANSVRSRLPRLLSWLDVTTGLLDEPANPVRPGGPEPEARAVSATCGGHGDCGPIVPPPSARR